MTIAQIIIDGTTAIACLDPDDVLTIQAALKDSSRCIQQQLDRCAANACCSGHKALRKIMCRKLEKTEELHARIAQITGVE